MELCMVQADIQAAPAAIGADAGHQWAAVCTIGHQWAAACTTSLRWAADGGTGRHVGQWDAVAAFFR